MNYLKLTVEPHKQMKRCHSRDVWGEIVPMDVEQPHWITKAIIILAGIYGIALWAMPSAHSAALRAEPQASQAKPAAVIAKGEAQ